MHRLKIFKLLSELLQKKRTKFRFITTKFMILVVAILIFGFGITQNASAFSIFGSKYLNLIAGQSVKLKCFAGKLTLTETSKSQWKIDCQGMSEANPTVTPTPTSVVSNTPTPTNGPNQNSPTPTSAVTPTPNPGNTTGTSMQLWHTPGAHDNLNPHEHGDKPPAWADEFSNTNFGHPVIFGGDERSGEMEVTMKHQAFKGVAYRVNTGSSCPIDVYFRYHAASNPMDRAFAFHSYELYMRDCQNGISFRQGVYWVGYPEFRSQRMSRYNEQPGTLLPNGSPAPGRDQFIIGSPDNRDWFGLNGILQTRCEQWYAFAGPHGGEFSITICGATTRFKYDEHLTDYHNMSTWDLTGGTGLGRRFEISLYGPNSSVPTNQPSGWFCAKKDPVEDKVEGPNHRPSWPLITNGITSPTSCQTGYLPQFTAPTFPNTGIYFKLGNTLDTKTFPGAGVVAIPN